MTYPIQGKGTIRQRLREGAKKRMEARATGRPNLLPLHGKSMYRPISPGSSKELDGWESELTTHLAGLRLLGELNLTRAELDNLTRDIRMLIHKCGDSQATQSLHHEYPVTLAVFLVFCGVYDYQGGDYWGPVSQRVGVDRVGQRWGRVFEEVLNETKLEAFPEFDAEGALRYVSRILAHGGVPNSSLPSYFGLLAYSTKRSDWMALPTRDLIAEWHARKFGFIQSDKPVQRFLVYGGSVAEDFLQRSLDMVEMTLVTGCLPLVQESHLPSRITEAFATWITQREVEVIPAARRFRLNAPRLLFDPWAGDGLLLEFPPEPLSEGSEQVEWRLQMGGKSRIVTGQTVRGEHLTSKEAEILLPNPATRWDVALVVDGAQLGAWCFSGISPDRPLLVFDPNTSKFLSWSDALPAREVWLIFPSESDVRIETGNGTEERLPELEQFPGLHSGWRRYKAVWTDLTSVRQVTVVTRGLTGRTVTIPVRLDGRNAGRPESSVKEAAIPGIWAGVERLPVVGRVPVIRIPPDTWEEDDNANRWSVMITPRSGSVPAERVVRRVGDLAWSHNCGAGVEVDLCQRALLPANALGTFSVSIRGPLGKDARFDFAIVPGLAIGGQDDHCNINRRDGDPATMIISTTAPLLVKSSSRDMLVDPSGHREWRVRTVGRQIALGIFPADSLPAGAAEKPAVELIVPIPMLRWTVLGLGGRQTLEWSTSEVSLSRDKLKELDDPAIIVDGFHTRNSPTPSGNVGEARLTLLSSMGEVLQEYTAPIRGNRLSILLSRFMDTLRERDDGVLVFTLSIWDTNGRGHVIGRPVLRVTRALNVSCLHVEDRLIDDGGTQRRELNVAWQQPYRVSGRELRIWSLTRPWEPAQRVRIPDDADETFRFSLPLSKAPPGRYRFAMAVADDWAPEFISRPSARSGLRDVMLGKDELFVYLERPLVGTQDLLETFFLAGSPESLSGIRDRLVYEDPVPALTTLAALLSTDEADVFSDETLLKAAIKELRESLIDHPDLLYSVVTSIEDCNWMTPEGNAMEDVWPKLRLLAALGLPQLSPEAIARRVANLTEADRMILEQEFPLLFLHRTGADLIRSELERAAAENIFGCDELRCLLPSLKNTEHFGPIWRMQADAVRDRFGYRPDPLVAKLSLIQLQVIRDMFIPSSLFSEETYFSSVLNCMIELNDPRNVEFRRRTASWAADVAAHAETVFDQMQHDDVSPADNDLSGVLLAIDLVRMRYQPNLRGIELVPFAVGATALLQRLFARRADLRHAIRSTPDLWLQHGVDAATVVPNLYVHDLCLLDLLIMPTAAEPDHRIPHRS